MRLHLLLVALLFAAAIVPSNAGKNKKNKKKKKSPKGKCYLKKGLTRFDEIGDSDTEIELSPGNPGVGDRYIWNNELLRAGTADHVVGRVYGSCDRTRESGDDGAFVWSCTSSYVLTDGKITLAGNLADDADGVSLWAVTGGTGCYKNTAGMSTVSLPGGDTGGLWQHELHLMFN